MADDMARHSISLAMQMTERAVSMIATELLLQTCLRPLPIMTIVPGNY